MADPKKDMAALAVAIRHVVSLAQYYVRDQPMSYQTSDDGELDEKAIELVDGLCTEMEEHYG